MDAAAPPVAQLLRQEAAAWESLLQLHTALSATQKQALAPPSEPEGGGHASPHSRAYLSSLTHLAACGDALVAEALKLRSLRSARDSLETAMYRHVVVHHQEQFFKRGEATSRAVTGDVLQNTADLRSEVSRARTELTQLRAALEALDGAAVRLPAAARVVVGLRYADDASDAGDAAAGAGASSSRWGDDDPDDGDAPLPPVPKRPTPAPSLQTVEEFLRRCVAHSGGTAVTDEVLVAALLQTPPPEESDDHNRFRRRKS